MLSKKFGAVSVLLLGACASGGGESSTSTSAPIPQSAPRTLASMPVGSSFTLVAYAGMEAFGATAGLSLRAQGGVAILGAFAGKK